LGEDTPGLVEGQQHARIMAQRGPGRKPDYWWREQAG
jgi:hypothetical protein